MAAPKSPPLQLRSFSKFEDHEKESIKAEMLFPRETPDDGDASPTFPLRLKSC
ncbi:MAG: hypothetical protein MI685_02255 [Chlorobiales bacterium]|nr:hypothetical protein [Chlorobiales bacterium]